MARTQRVSRGDAELAEEEETLNDLDDITGSTRFKGTEKLYPKKPFSVFNIFEFYNSLSVPSDNDSG
ncbi:MAG: hypothetical protein SGI71_03770 [Verrucomicrobiota bacterium]|nr:hypothetical protein [Verrucomicrobiota bacterium]